MQAMIDKHARIKKIGGPKVLLVGGSNLAFGVNSELLQRELAVPVVNLGLHAGLGLSFMVNELKSIVQDGDIVFLSTEYFLSDEGIPDLQLLASKSFPAAKSYYSTNFIEQSGRYLENTQTKFKSLFTPFHEGPKVDSSVENTGKKIYSRKAFNKFGDNIANAGLTAPTTLNDRVVYTYRSWEGIEMLNDLWEMEKTKNVTLYFLFPPFPESEYKTNTKVIQMYLDDLKTKLHFHIVGKPEDFVFPDDLFFDTVYHLTEKGRNRRTALMVELMRADTQVFDAIKNMKDKYYSSSNIID
jgi:hypothetical protein